MSEEEIYKLLTDSVAYRYYDNDHLEMDYDEEHEEYVLWYQNKFDVAHYSVATGTVY